MTLLFLANVTSLGARYGADEYRNALYVWPILILSLSVYVLYLRNLLLKRPLLRFRVRGLLLLTTFVAVLSAFGHALDAALMLSFLGYAYLTGPLFQYWVAYLWRLGAPRPRTTLVWTSIAILATFVSLVTPVALWFGLSSKEIGSELLLLLNTSHFWAGYLLYLGDTAQSAYQVISYGWPIGLALNVFFAALLGAVLGGIAIWLAAGRDAAGVATLEMRMG